MLTFMKDIDSNSLFQHRGRAPDKSTVKRRFHTLNVTRGAETQMAGSLATFAFHCGAVSARSRAPDGVHIARRFHATSTATLKTFKSHVSQLLQRGASHSESAIRARSHRPTSDRQATAR